ncbi:MAG: class I SAM-dependent methyltransferase [Planctomycetaceae bacterium]
MKLSEDILYALAKKLYRNNPGQDDRMAAALANDETYGVYRSECLNKVLAAANRYNVKYVGKDVLDLGCFDGTITQGLLESGVRSAVGVDIDADAIETARKLHTDQRIRFLLGNTDGFPLEDNSVDTIISYDVFEHVETPKPILQECYRVLRPGGQMLIGTWGWYHPFAPHLWSTMPVPWAHLFFSERTILRTCRRVYQSDWYAPNMHDFDKDGQRIADKYTHEKIPTQFLNKFLIRDFQKVFRESPLDFEINPNRFASEWAAWTTPFLRVPFLKEFFTAYIWVVLTCPTSKPQPTKTNSAAQELVEVSC